MTSSPGLSVSSSPRTSPETGTSSRAPANSFAACALIVPALVALEKRNRLYRSAAARLGSRRRAGGSWSRNTSLCSAEMICDTGSATARSRAGGILKLHGAEDDSDAETPFPSETRAIGTSADVVVVVVASPSAPSVHSFSAPSPETSPSARARRRMASRRRRSVTASVASRSCRRSASLRNRSFSARSRSKDRVKRGAHAAATSEMDGRRFVSVVRSRSTIPTSAAEYIPGTSPSAPPPPPAPLGV